MNQLCPFNIKKYVAFQLPFLLFFQLPYATAAFPVLRFDKRTKPCPSRCECHLGIIRRQRLRTMARNDMILSKGPWSGMLSAFLTCGAVRSQAAGGEVLPLNDVFLCAGWI